MAYSSSNTASPWHITQSGFTRSLNESLDNAKEQAGDTYSGMKRTVQDNMILSIIIAVVVFALLILCCYLRKKYSRSAQVVSRREYKQILKSRQERDIQMNERRELEKHDLRCSKENELNNRDKNFHSHKADDRQRRPRGRHGDDNNEDGPNLAANMSMETTGTALSNEEVNFVDMENGQGFEVESPLNASPDAGEDSHQFDLDEETAEESPKKKSFFSRKKKDKQGSF